MDINSKLKICLTSTGIIVGCAGLTYLFLSYRRRLRDAADALNYLTIKTVCMEKECNEVVKELQRRCSPHRSVGFDCEWVTDHGSRRPVALVQLSTFDGYCGLFRLSKLTAVPPSLKELLEDEHIYKVGVAPTDDAKYLFQDYDVMLKSSLDIRHIAKLCAHNPGGLAALAKSTLNILLDKSWRIRCSDWDADQLTDRQVKYAAADAHVAIKMFVNFINELNRNTWSLFDGNKCDVWSQLDEVCWKYADVKFKQSQNTKAVKSDKAEKNESLGPKTIQDSCINLSSDLTGMFYENIKHAFTKHASHLKIRGSAPKQAKDVTLSKRYPHATRSKPLYHNCFLQAPDGELLCTCDNKKALWYVEKKLADVVIDDPLTVRLRFEPSGRSVGDVGRYYQLTKENKCVVCGSTNSYIRKNVVPREYRKYFPEIMKEHSSHDVVLLCVRCHQRSNVGDQAVRERLAEQCGAPLASADSAKYLEDANTKKIRSAARAVQSKKHVLPEARRKYLESVVLEYYNQETLTDELLQEAADMQVVFENSDYESHGLKVVEWYLEKGGGLLRLEEIWREHFLAAMRPKYMPELWSVKHNEERLRVKLKEGRLSDEELKSVGASRLL